MFWHLLLRLEYFSTRVACPKRKVYYINLRLLEGLRGEYQGLDWIAQTHGIDSTTSWTGREIGI
jgi:hypothetical protein